MFKEQYIRDNEKLHAKEALFMEIQDKLNQESKKTSRRSTVLRWTAVAAAALLVVGGTLGIVLANARTTKPGPADHPQVLSADAADTVKAFDSYDELYNTIISMNSGRGAVLGGMTDDIAVEEEASSADMAAPSAAPAEGATGATTQANDGGSGHSETNVQVAGVDEADIIKTDGEYIYYIYDNTLYIARAAGKDTQVLSKTSLDDSGDTYWRSSAEMYLLGDRLMIISQGWSVVWVAREGSPYESGQNETRVMIFDVSNRNRPKEVTTLGQSGSYVSSRMIGDMVYLVTSQYVYGVFKNEPITYVPSTSVNDEARVLPASDVLVCGTPNESAYTVIGAINLKSGTAHQSAKALFGGTGNIYCSGEHLLIAQSNYTEDVRPIAPDKNGKNVQITASESTTKLVLFSLDDGKIEKLASGAVPGYLLNQFAMDEYKGVFRIVTTVNKWVQYIYTDGVDTYDYESENYNCLYTLDAELNMLGKIENLAKDEWVESVRFDGDIGYFVTFRQTDPLFAVDLSDPNRPKVLSSLKIPGFSEYLHVYGEGLLFGIGYQADEDTGRREGVKLSMFDTSNKAKVTELTTERLDATNTVVGYNHKAILVDVNRNLIAFPADGAYYIYSYDAQKGFEQLKKVGVSNDMWSDGLRGLFIDKTFYVVSEKGITVIDMNAWEVETSLKW